MYEDQVAREEEGGLTLRKSSMLIGVESSPLRDAPFTRLKPDSAQQMHSEVYISEQDDMSQKGRKIRVND